MGMDGNGLSVADALALQDTNKNGGFMDGNGMWVFFLFFLLAWGGGGFGFGGNSGMNGAAMNGALTRAELNDGFAMNDLTRQVYGTQKGICDGFYDLNTTMLNGFNGIERQLCDNRFAAQQCCCETNRNIDAVRYENSRNTCDIVNAIHADGDATRALITANEMQTLRDKLQAAEMQLSQQAQNATLIGELRPCAKPAYITCSPYQATGMCGQCC